MPVRDPALLDVPDHAPQSHKGARRRTQRRDPLGLTRAHATGTGYHGSHLRLSSRSFVPLRRIWDRARLSRFWTK